MKEIIEHIKKVAIQDFKDFFAPFVTVYKWIRHVIRASTTSIKRRLFSSDKEDAE